MVRPPYIIFGIGVVLAFVSVFTDLFVGGWVATGIEIAAIIALFIGLCDPMIQRKFPKIITVHHVVRAKEWVRGRGE